MSSYRHTTYGEVTVHQDYGTFCMVNSGSAIKAAYWKDLTEVKDNVVELSQRLPTPEPEPTPETEEDTTPKLLNLNAATFTQISQTLPYIGKFKAKRVKERQLKQADERYLSFAHFKEVNADILEDETAWQSLEPLISFEAE